MRNNRIVYYDSFSVAVINSKSKLRRLYCPFMVKCINTTDGIKADSYVYVDQVLNDSENKLLFKIGGKLYSYSDFRISINF